MRAEPIIAFAGGGSGGHLYPALAVAGALRASAPEMRFVFFGTDRTIDAGVLSNFDGRLVRQPVRPLPQRAWQWPSFLLAWRNSTRECRRFFQTHRPMVVVGSGGYASAPAICEAARVGISTALLNPDAVPGKANRLLESRVDVVFAQWAETCEHFSGQAKMHVTGCPVRPEFKAARRVEGIEHFGLDPDKRVLLVTGASQGARSINEAVLAALPALGAAGVWERWQLLHLTGPEDQEHVAAAHRRHGINARVVGFTRHMAIALAAADLVVARAGASTLAELTATGRPSVLMPYPHHGDQHQVANARMLVKVGAARMLLDQVDPNTNGPALAEVLGRLVGEDEELARMSVAAQRIGTTSAAEEIAGHLLHVADKHRRDTSGETVEELCSAGR